MNELPEKGDNGRSTQIDEDYLKVWRQASMNETSAKYFGETKF